jgi:DNA polymerase/3'-5' exonuclease PolX
MADLLAAQEADGFKVLAYRRAADTVEKLVGPIGEILLTQGIDGLDVLPEIGKGIAAAIAEMVRVDTGRNWSGCEGRSTQELFQTIHPGMVRNLPRRS